MPTLFCLSFDVGIVKKVLLLQVTENKFCLEEARPELTEDWDQRFLVSTLRRAADGTRLTLEQRADQDQVIY